MSNFNRRHTLKLLVAATVGLPALGYWAQSQAAIQQLLDSSDLTATQQDVLAAAADTIIPKGEMWGAVELGVPLYLLQYFDQCLEKDTQDNIKTQLNALEQAAKTQHKRSFMDCSQREREILLLRFANSEQQAEKDFFDLLKDQTIHGFKTTKEVMTGPYHYRIAPGHFHGCVDLNALSNT